MTEKEQFQHYRLMPPWRRWLIIAFGISLPVFFGAIVFWLIMNSHAPLWVLAIGAFLGLGSGAFQGALAGSRFHSKTICSWAGFVSALLLVYTLRLITNAIPLHPTPLAFTTGYTMSFVVGVCVGSLPFSLKFGSAAVSPGK